MADELRTSIRRRLAVGPMTVGDICGALNAELQEVADTLRGMRREGIVVDFVNGALIFWRLK